MCTICQFLFRKRGLKLCFSFFNAWPDKWCLQKAHSHHATQEGIAVHRTILTLICLQVWYPWHTGRDGPNSPARGRGNNPRRSWCCSESEGGCWSAAMAQPGCQHGGCGPRSSEAPHRRQFPPTARELVQELSTMILAVTCAEYRRRARRQGYTCSYMSR